MLSQIMTALFISHKMENYLMVQIRFYRSNGIYVTIYGKYVVILFKFLNDMVPCKLLNATKQNLYRKMVHLYFIKMEKILFSSHDEYVYMYVQMQQNKIKTTKIRGIYSLHFTADPMVLKSGMHTIYIFMLTC